jgi:hypothetical protein
MIIAYLLVLVCFIIGIYFLYMPPYENQVIQWNMKKLNYIEKMNLPPPIAARDLAIFHRKIYDAIINNQDINTIARQSLEETSYNKDIYGDPPCCPIDPEWQPTPDAYMPPLLPNWGNESTFIVDKCDDFMDDHPPERDSDEYKKSYEEVKLIGEKDSKHRTKDQTDSAKFWDLPAGTITPPGMWNLIAQKATKERKLSNLETARLFLQLNYALSDAGVCAWRSKYIFNLWRPVTAIRQEDESWTPLLNTPPFPSCMSGHSTFSAAAGTVLINTFGDMPFCIEYKEKRCFKGFTDAYKDAGASRIYGGIHWSYDNTIGLDIGKKIGDIASKNNI